MQSKCIVYIDSCGFIDAVKHSVGSLPNERTEDVWHIKKLLAAHRGGDIRVVTSYLSIAECVAIEPGQTIVPNVVQEHFRRLLTSGQYVSLLQQTPRTANIAQELRWRYNLVLGGADALHFAAAIEASAVEFITTDDHLRKPKIVAATEILAERGIRLIRATATGCLPDTYRQGEMLNAEK